MFDVPAPGGPLPSSRSIGAEPGRMVVEELDQEPWPEGSGRGHPAVTPAQPDSKASSSGPGTPVPKASTTEPAKAGPAKLEPAKTPAKLEPAKAPAKLEPAKPGGGLKKP